MSREKLLLAGLHAWRRIGRLRSYSCHCHAAPHRGQPWLGLYPLLLLLLLLLLLFVSLASYHRLLYSAPPKYLPLCPVHANTGALGRRLPIALQAVLGKKLTGCLKMEN
ncbi:hypothetical protein TRV_05120 [Trichophyton verrucosum HKI 0517]|uniref:Uncharacterized protein n=1 Tax=Trichophyton verrucosum (strain HKI 0517) TaxID=663202 RepID=D4DDB2_TRIVH|nr:uncharacterized protein TRV_05120 [Trichophyton verrucosum HKI 0517]EFE40168.1 hypothetical protein TRV_05120 [Trichophyton verrucosum HKI 0517]